MRGIDIVILSNARNERLKSLTEQTVQTLYRSDSSGEFSFNVIVIESAHGLKPYQYPKTVTIYPDTDFGFNKYMNIGLNKGKYDLVCFCNNDLVFHDGWAAGVINSFNADPDLSSLGCYCPLFHADKPEISDDINYGYTNGIYFTGWCFVVKRSVFDITGKFDEKFKFWYADDDFRLTLQKFNLKNGLARNARVTHLGSETLSGEKSSKQFALQYRNYAYYRYKWQHHNPMIYLIDRLKYFMKTVLPIN